MTEEERSELRKILAPIPKFINNLVKPLWQGQGWSGGPELKFSVCVEEKYEDKFLILIEKLLEVEREFGNRHHISLWISRSVHLKDDGGLDQNYWWFTIQENLSVRNERKAKGQKIEYEDKARGFLKALSEFEEEQGVPDELAERSTYIPKSIISAVKYLDNDLDEAARNRMIQSSSEDLSLMHFTLGQWIRNAWVYPDDSPLLETLSKVNLKREDADEISSVIIHSLSEYIKSGEINIREVLYKNNIPNKDTDDYILHQILYGDD